MERLMTGNKNYKPGQLVTINNHVYKICNCFHMSKKQYEERNGCGCMYCNLSTSEEGCSLITHKSVKIQSLMATCATNWTYYLKLIK